MATAGPGTSVSVGGTTVFVVGIVVWEGAAAVAVDSNAVAAGEKAVFVGCRTGTAGGAGVMLVTPMHAVSMTPSKQIPIKRKFFFIVASLLTDVTYHPEGLIGKTRFFGGALREVLRKVSY